MVKARKRQEYQSRDQIQIKRALISVSDKTGLVELARQLAENGVELISTGSTAQRIADAGLAVTQVSDVTGFPESLDGRVKTLHPAVHAGLLADLRLAAHQQQLHDLGIAPFELVVVNLYPFQETVASGADAANVIENIDIGGPAMVRASAKNFQNVAIVVDPSDYASIVDQIEQGGTGLKFREGLARKAFAHTANYDGAVSAWFEGEAAASESAASESASSESAAAGVVAGAVASSAAASVSTSSASDVFASEETVALMLESGLRYGENSHQNAALYVQADRSGIAQATQHGGKEMSYNNYVDADAALRAAYDFDEPAVAVIKHTNPCGVAVADTIAKAHEKAHATDPLSAFGGVIAANRVITKEAAAQIAPIFTEVIVAPGYEAEALEILTEKKNLRILELPENFQPQPVELRQISGGFLAQEADRFQAEGDNPANWELVSGDAADAETLADLAFAWRAVRAVKSNAILLAKDQAAVGIGMGQVNRVDSCQLAIGRAGDRAQNSVAASDAFFPFADGVEALIAANVSAIVQPGGSVRDDEVIAAAKAAGITMYFTGTRHFFH